ncbi:PLDc_N domain-containing protein [Lacihabitans sp. LS3-19]|uniref:PLDc N-terminal domain-containing protein n=1 Tax=Lacihabitans sp. LS3-19 TaxID=2487335 RepID=UPI0020CC06F7|nr:PLD nuclease N-terminal domain-containing protein [Lacihabitans sp. LS3-19]MCP9768758.1 PLDc_N domain-containing protein [Lacihabitans sp. LS3-19]
MATLFLGNFGLTELFVILFIILIPLSLVFWIIAILDLIKRQFNDQSTKLIWALVILLVPFFGSILYFLVGKKGGVLKVN